MGFKKSDFDNLAISIGSMIEIRLSDGRIHQGQLYNTSRDDGIIIEPNLINGAIPNRDDEVPPVIVFFERIDYIRSIGD